MNVYQKEQKKVKLSTSEDGPAKIWTCIENRGDKFLYGLKKMGKDKIKYHRRSCNSSLET